MFFWPWGLWDLSSLTRNQAHTPFIKRRSVNHRTTRQVPKPFFYAQKVLHIFSVLYGFVFGGPCGRWDGPPGKSLGSLLNAWLWPREAWLRWWSTSITCRSQPGFLISPSRLMLPLMRGEVSSPEAQRLVWTECQCRTLSGWLGHPWLLIAPWELVMDWLAPSRKIFISLHSVFPSRNMTSFSIYTWVSFLYLLERFSSSLYVLWPYFFQLNPR